MSYSHPSSAPRGLLRWPPARQSRRRGSGDAPHARLLGVELEWQSAPTPPDHPLLLPEAAPRLGGDVPQPASSARKYTSGGIFSSRFQRAPAVSASGATPRRRFSAITASTAFSGSCGASQPPSKCIPPLGL